MSETLPEAEIIAVGSELLTPSKIDTNSLWLTAQLNALGIEVATKTIVGDERTRLTSAVRNALARSEMVFLSGGLGPTEDDVTRDAVAAALGREQSFQQELWDDIVNRFRRMNRTIAENNKRQAFLVEGAESLPNSRGSAPGQWIETQGRILALLPGPPNELQAMFEAQCLPRLQKIAPPAVIATRFYRVAGMGESDLDQLIAPVYTQYANPVTTILAGPGDIQIHLRARCATAVEAESLLAQVGPQIEALLGDRLYTGTGDSLEAVIGDLLTRRSETLAVAESVTGGMIGERLTTVPGSSRYFQGGFLTYTDRSKESLLGVDCALLEQHTAVSEPVAQAMASSARSRMGTDWGLAVTGYAGPGGGTEADPAGTVFLAVEGPGVSLTKRLQFLGDRTRVRTLTTTSALDLLRRMLLRTEK